MPLKLSFENMENATLEKIMKQNGVDLFGVADFKKLTPVNQRLYDALKQKGAKSVIVLALPYKSGLKQKDKFNMSAYARVRDYHARFAALFESLARDLKAAFPGCFFDSYSDHSPINEKEAALFAGLGIRGLNTLLITKKYGTFVFLGGVVTDKPFKSADAAPKACAGCDKCVRLCPTGALTVSGGHAFLNREKCLSAVSQKTKKSPAELELLKKHKVVWGCDICQDVCPYNRDITPCGDDYFINGFIGDISYDFIKNMPDEVFSLYPFSWRKKEVILENLSLFSGEDIT